MLTHIGVIITCIAIVKDDGIVWYETVVATEDSPTWVSMRRLLLLITVLPDVCEWGGGGWS